MHRLVDDGSSVLAGLEQQGRGEAAGTLRNTKQGRRRGEDNGTLPLTTEATGSKQEAILITATLTRYRVANRCHTDGALGKTGS